MARPRTRKIDNVVWQLSVGSGLALSAGTVGVNFASVGTAPTTLLRIRGQLLLWVDTPQAPGVSCVGTWGIIKVPEGSGTTVQYDPVADANAPWLAFGAGILAYEEMVTDVIDVPGATADRQTVDNKAMRRIRPDEELQFVMNNTTVQAALSFNFAYTMRWLQGF